MNERVVEILIYIMSEIRKNQSASGKLDLLSQDLIQQGYSESEISSAFTWLLDRLNHETEELVERQDPSLPSSVRHLHEIERAVVSVPAQGYIIQLRELGLIDELDVEQILERAMMLGHSPVTSDEIKSIVATMLFSADPGMGGSFFIFDETPIVQ